MPGLTDTTVAHHLGLAEELAESTVVSLCGRQYAVRQPLNKESEKPRTRAPKIQHLVIPVLCNTNAGGIALKKQHTKKNKEEAAEYTKLQNILNFWPRE